MKKIYTGKNKTRRILSENLVKLRNKSKLSQSELALLVGVSLQAIKMFEWKKLYPSEKTLETLAKVFKTEVYILLKPSRKPNNIKTKKQ